MYLTQQIWGGLVIALFLGLGLGVWGRKLMSDAFLTTRLDAVRQETSADLLHLRSELEDLREHHANDLQLLGDDHARAVQISERNFAEERRQLKERHEQDLQAALERLQAELAGARQRVLVLAQDQHTLRQRAEQAESQMDALMADNERLRSDLSAVRDQRRTDAAAWMARVRATAETAAANDGQGHARLEQLQAELEAGKAREVDLVEQLKRLNQSSDVSRRVQVDSLLARTEALGQAQMVAAEVEGLRRRLDASEECRVQAEARALGLTADLEATRSMLIRQETESESSTDDLREQLEASRRTMQFSVSAAEAKEERLSVEIIELRAEVERLMHEKTESAKRLVRQHRASPLVLLDAHDVERLIREAGKGRPPLAAVLEGRAPDDLKQIAGVDAPTESWFHGMGIFYFWQVAAWTPEEAAWVAQHLPMSGQNVWRQNWMARSARLAAKESLTA